MFKTLKKSSSWALSITTIIFTFVPEMFFSRFEVMQKFSDEINIILVRLLLFIIILILTTIITAIYLRFRNSISIKGKNYIIKIKYGDILEIKNCKRVISFDECFTTKLGNQPADVNIDSICGQYLRKYPIQDMKMWINQAELKPIKSKSEYQKKDRYKAGKIVPKNDDLLMAFAKLDENGLGKFDSYTEYKEVLSTLWKEINKYYNQKSVCMPILGSGVTRMNGSELTQQELLDVIITSYKLSSYKIKSPCKLYIICKKQEGFSLNKIGQNI